MSYFGSITQNVQSDTVNSYVGTIAGGATWNGAQATGTSTLGVSGIQVNVYVDQDCTVYVDQSMDNSNWRITDAFDYVGGSGMSWTVQATASYVRVRVKNLSGTTANAEIQTALCPIVEAVPRALDEDGFLKVGVHCIQDDETTYESRIDQFNNLKVAQLVRLVGTRFIGTTKDTNFWTEAVAGTGAVSQGSGYATLTTGATANSTVQYQSVRAARYVGGTTNICRMLVQLSNTGSANNSRRWGMFDASNGFYFSLDGTVVNITARSGGVDGTPVAAASWSEFKRFAPGTTWHAYEIWSSLTDVLYFVDGTLVHKETSTAAAALLTQVLSLPVTFQNNNSSGGTANVSMNAAFGVIHRLGQLVTQPIAKFQSGTTAGVTYKFGAGNLHRVVFSSVTNGSVVTLYDNTSAAGTIIFQHTFSFGNQGGQNIYPVDFGGLPFSTGLTLAITTQNANVTTVYE